MKVLHICNDYYESTIYGNLHRQLLSRNVGSVMFVPLENRYVDKDEELNVVQAKCFNKVDRLLFFYKQRKILNAVRGQIEENRPDLIHSHFVFSAGYVGMRMKQERGIPYIVAVQNTDVNLFFRLMINLRGVGIQVLLNAEKVVFISSSYRDSVITRYIPEEYRDGILKKSVVLPFGIDEFWLTNHHAKTRRDERELHLITVGAINRNKNQLTVAKSAALLNSRGYQTTYTIVGRIEDRRVYNELMKYSFVRHKESCPKEQLVNCYRQADILVMPSVTESFGLVYAEAMSQGLPVIYSKGQGFDAQFEEGEVGYGVNSLDSEEIVERIISINENYEAISRRCASQACTFSWERIAPAYVEMYEAIAKDGGENPVHAKSAGASLDD